MNSIHHQPASAAAEITDYDEHDEQLVEGAGIVISVAIGLALWAVIAAVVMVAWPPM
jgi:hypothetical protein